MTGAGDDTPKITTDADLEFRRYEARLGVWKVVLGTGIVGLAGILIPAAIQMAQMKQAKETAYQAYIKEFVSTAINQDIELRIRFATYFTEVSDSDQQVLWKNYRDALTKQRETKRVQINELEAKLVGLEKAKAYENDTANYDAVKRELEWAYSEVGYVPINRSVVKPPSSTKERLYNEAIAVAERLASQTTKLDKASPDWVRFWDLYWKDLRAVESAGFAWQMVQIGDVLKALEPIGALPNDELRKAVAELRILARDELSGAESQPQQQNTPRGP